MVASVSHCFEHYEDCFKAAPYPYSVGLLMLIYLAYPPRPPLPNNSMRRRRSIHQGEGCEQGVALAPAVYLLGQHDALVAADERLQLGECLAAFLVHVVTTPARGREALDIAMSMIQDRAGNAANVGKTRVYTRAGGPAPPGIAELGDRVSTGNAPEAERDFSPWAHPSATLSMSRRTRTRACGRRHSCCTNSPSCLTCNVRGSLLPCVLPRLQITCYAPCLPTFQHPMHVATMLQCCSACVTGHEDPDITAARLGGVGLQSAEGLRPAQFDLPELGARWQHHGFRTLCVLEREKTFCETPSTSCPNRARWLSWQIGLATPCFDLSCELHQQRILTAQDVSGTNRYTSRLRAGSQFPQQHIQVVGWVCRPVMGTPAVHSLCAGTRIHGSRGLQKGA